METLEDEGHLRMQIFKEKSGELGKNKEILNLHLPSVIRTILRSSHGVQFNVLSVGSGDGAIDMEVLQIVHTELQRDDKYQDMKIFNRAFEPNPLHTSLYKRAIENIPDSLKSKTAIELCENKFEETESSQEDPVTKFDLVHFNQSIYFFDIEQTLKRCFEKELRQNGQIVVVVEGNDLAHSVYVTAADRSWRSDPEETFGQEVIKVIVKNGWKYEMFSQEYEIDVTEVFDEDSIQGNLLLDFMTQSVKFRSTVHGAHIEKVLSLIREQTAVRDGKRLGKKMDVILVISK